MLIGMWSHNVQMGEIGWQLRCLLLVPVQLWKVAGEPADHLVTQKKAEQPVSPMCCQVTLTLTQVSHDTVEFSSSWYLRALESQHALCPVSVPPASPWNQLQCQSDWQHRALSHPLRGEHQVLPLSCLSPLGNQRCNTLGFVSACSEALQHLKSLETPTTCGGCFARQSTAAGLFALQSSMSWAVHTDRFWMWLKIVTCQFPFHFRPYNNTIIFTNARNAHGKSHAKRAIML